jgi:hypothetical protein
MQIVPARPAMKDERVGCVESENITEKTRRSSITLPDCAFLQMGSFCPFSTTSRSADGQSISLSPAFTISAP